MSNVLGIHASFLKTVGILWDNQAKDMMRFVASSSAIGRVGIGEATEVLGEIEGGLRELTQQSHLDFLADVESICIGMSGIPADGSQDGLDSVVVKQGWDNVSKIQILNDAEIALASENDILEGVVVKCGTGSKVYGMNGAGSEVLIGYCGFPISDEGSGYYLGRQVLQYIIKAKEKRGNECNVLESRLLSHTGFANINKLVVEIHSLSRHEQREMISDFVIALQEATDDYHDRIGLEILERGAEEIASQVMAVISELNKTGKTTSIILEGGVIRNYPLYAEMITKRIKALYPEAEVQKTPIYEPALGAVLYAISGSKLLPKKSIISDVREAWHKLMF